jgi:hypothetical protein
MPPWLADLIHVNDPPVASVILSFVLRLVEAEGTARAFPPLSGSKELIPMRYVNLAAAALLGMIAMPALAQAPPVPNPATGARPGHVPGVGESLPQSNKASNIVPGDTRSNIAPTLPSSALGENAGPNDYLKAARASLVAGRTGQAQQLLEMAETRALDRSVPQGQIAPSDSTFVSAIRDARHALGGGDSAHAIQLIDRALSS